MIALEKNLVELQLDERAYHIIHEIIPYLRDIGLSDQQSRIIDELSVAIADCFFGIGHSTQGNPIS